MEFVLLFRRSTGISAFVFRVEAWCESWEMKRAGWYVIESHILRDFLHRENLPYRRPLLLFSCFLSPFPESNPFPKNGNFHTLSAYSARFLVERPPHSA